MIKYAIIMLLLCGCLSKNQEQATKLAFETQTEMTTATPIVKGNNNSITITGDLPETKKDIVAKNKADMTESSYIGLQISVCLNILLLGIGLVAIKSSLRGSKTVSMVSSAIDSVVATAIGMASTASDHKDIASANHLRAEIESIRKFL